MDVSATFERGGNLHQRSLEPPLKITKTSMKVWATFDGGSHTSIGESTLTLESRLHSSPSQQLLVSSLPPDLRPALFRPLVVFRQ
ncbi:hypothetical protein LWI28_020572 [Acer negundo]|uniref:Uncharacterized protein n=1 Tax=Acer negundo TaxID=4023 RepID=A0AAD5J0Q7_ACENE|nr:hypothetical protein LWI28_020572 [Acer negundo]